MSDVGIDVQNVWKKFHRGELFDSLREVIPALAKRLSGRSNDRAELSGGDFWALKDVSFRVNRGEALGIIGPNGAGKSTMLKLLTRILRPTSGYCEVRGRVGALIEVAAGFHGDLTGRENIYLQGVIMGMKRADIARKLEEIVDFAGVGQFIDTPVKRYSSGMNARLGFSVAAHLDPDILLIDEVLSVGDMGFQEKCIERMKSFKRQGVAIVFISHNLQAVAGLCEEALYLNSEIRAQGPVHLVLERYVRATDERRTTAPGAAVTIVGAELLDQRGVMATVVRPGARLTLRVTYLVLERMSDVTLGFVLHRSTDGLTVYVGNFRNKEHSFNTIAPGQRVVVDFCFRAPLTRGLYHAAVHAYHTPTQTHLTRLCPAGIFSVEENRTYGGVADLQVECTVAGQANTSGTRRGIEQCVE